MFPHTNELNLAGWCHLAYFGALLPLLTIRGRNKVIGPNKPPPNRLRYFKTTAFSLAMFALMSLMVARAQWIDLFPKAGPGPIAIAAGVVLYLAAVAYTWPIWRRAVELRLPVVHLFMPSNGRERVWWVVVSVLAGVGEEITWRGTQAALVDALVGHFWIAAFICSVMFGAVHIIQGWRSAWASRFSRWDSTRWSGWPARFTSRWLFTLRTT